MAERVRLDVALAARGLVESRAKAQELIRAGRVRVDGAVATKPSRKVGPEARIEVVGPEPYVGRAAHKLLGALAAFGIGPEGEVWADVGAGTGGFTQVLLEHGARRVYALDVGHGQLHPRLRADARVVVLEGVNARRPLALPEPVDGAVMDVSFISSTLILPNLWRVLRPGGRALVLVKPQFELEPGSHTGVVRDPRLQRRALERVRAAARALGFTLCGEAESPLAGKEGNREFWLYLERPDAGVS
ncbi:hemolysin A [Oceanithermus profundus DSM 14977]|uniref:Hemolysin A n=1 Tax=Oceanithermus profundus (strain DSM 14977 / NBRC 100410 / VKM B-2274 / 506) TaxID=670487 RepID=E4U456_OCEP5|nr:hemolysin A [Oceanithermus profundus DSM 14977]